MLEKADALIFAAGFGTRMGALTQNRPKPLVRVADKALMDHALDVLRDAGVQHVIANTHYLADQIEAHLAGTGAKTVLEWPDILETGGGLRHALPFLHTNPVITLNTDAVWAGPNPVSALLEHWHDGMEALLLCVDPARAHGHAGGGDFRMRGQGTLQRGGPLIYSGLQIIRTETLPQIKDKAFSLNVLWDEMLARGTLHGLVYDGHWCDVGRPEGIRLAEAMLRDAHV